MSETGPETVKEEVPSELNIKETDILLDEVPSVLPVKETDILVNEFVSELPVKETDILEDDDILQDESAPELSIKETDILEDEVAPKLPVKESDILQEELEVVQEPPKETHSVDIIPEERQPELPGKETDVLPGDTTQETTQTDWHPSKAAKCKSYCKKFVTFLFSHIGLCCLVVAYTIMGGFVFLWLEGEHEVLQQQAVKKMRKSMVDKLWRELIYEISYFNQTLFKQRTDTLLHEFQKDVYIAITKAGWDGKDIDGKASERQWSFAGALLYAVTVITTIGYGHIAPKTMAGRLVTIAYALIGIPLTLLCLANLSSFMGNGFRLLYNSMCRLCCSCVRRCATNPNKGKQLSMRNGINGSQKKKSMKYSTKSKNFTSIDIEQGGDEITPLNDSNTPICNNSQQKTSPVENNYEIKAEIAEYRIKNRVKGKEGRSKVSVPIWVSVLIIAGYILGGAVLFSKWENMNYVDGCYFVFITLSTIGFGDIVPGTQGADQSWETQEKLILISMYVLFGLATIAMCFDLMQEDVRNKMLWLAAKIGLIDKKH